MIDIVDVSSDLQMYDAQTPKASNIFGVQIGALEYAKDFGIDLAFFLNPDLQFQNESFKSYLIQRLAENNINVNQVVDSLEQFFLKFTFVVGDADKTTGSFIK